MKVVVYEEGPWIYIRKADDTDTDTDWIEVDDDTGNRWLETSDAWDLSVSEIRKKIR
jgi:hypothetical protein